MKKELLSTINKVNEKVGLKMFLTERAIITSGKKLKLVSYNTNVLVTDGKTQNELIQNLKDIYL